MISLCVNTNAVLSREGVDDIRSPIKYAYAGILLAQTASAIFCRLRTYVHSFIHSFVSLMRTLS